MGRKKIKISKQSARKALGVHATSIGALFMVASFAPATHTVAGTWDAQFSNNWNDYFNWSDFTVPNSAGATATFSNLSNQLSPTLSAAVQIGSITFNPGANAYTIETNGNPLSIVGAGIVNNSGRTQTIDNNGATSSLAAGSTTFNNSTAGNVLIVNDGSQVQAGSNTVEGLTRFSGTSTAGNAAIFNGATTVNNGFGGGTIFSDTSTAGNANITNQVSGFSGASAPPAPPNSLTARRRATPRSPTVAT